MFIEPFLTQKMGNWSQHFYLSSKITAFEFGTAFVLMIKQFLKQGDTKMKENTNMPNQNQNANQSQQGGQANKPNQSSVGTGTSAGTTSTSRDSQFNQGQSGGQQQRSSK